MTPATRLTRFASGTYLVMMVVAATMTVVISAQQEVPQQQPIQQQPTPAAKPQSKAQDFTSVSELIGAPVFLEASTEGEVAARASAKITECLIDSQTGFVTHAVVSIGGFLGIGDKTVLVPAAQLNWNAAERRYQLSWTQAELEARTAFDLGAACASGLDTSCAYAVDANTKKSVAEPADGKQPATATNAAFAAYPSHLVKGSELSALPVFASADSFGKVVDLIIDRANRKVVLAIVNHGSTLGVGGVNYLVAYPQLSLCTNEGNPVICARGRSIADLQACTKYEKPKDGIVDPKAAEQAMKVRKTDDGMNGH